MQIKEFLSKVGLDDHQVDVYLALVALGEATAGQIAKMSGVPRTYTYKILEELAEKDFIQSDSSRSIRRYSITDFDAPKRYLERKQLDLYKIQQEAQSMNVHLENMAHPSVPSPSSELLKDSMGEIDFWKLLHSTLTREIWVINPPEWWGNAGHTSDIKRWEEYRIRQHIWEKRFTAHISSGEIKFTEEFPLQSSAKQACLFLIDHYQVQVTNWKPFRALRIDNQDLVEIIKTVLQAKSDGVLSSSAS